MEKKNDSIPVHSGIRKASKAEFVAVKTERFKYFKVYNIFNLFFAALRPYLFFNRLKGQFALFILKFDIKRAIKDSLIWLINAFIEGLIINIALCALLNFKINLLTILAYGILIRKTIEITHELRLHGTSTKLLEKHK